MKLLRVLGLMVSAVLAGWFGLAAIAAAQAAGPYESVELPARIEAEHYDSGAEGVAWSDTDEHAGRGDFRTDDSVDAFVIERVGASGQTLLGRTRDGEFVQYTVEVPDAAEYEIRLRVASGADDPGVINVDIGGERIGTVDVIKDRWFDWVTMTAGTATLDAGTSVIRLTWADGANINLDWLDIRPTTPPPAQCPTGTLEAENATIAGRFQTYSTKAASAGQAVGVVRGTGGNWGGAGDSYIEFCTSVETAGEYRIDARLLAPTATKSSFWVSVDDGPLVTFVAPATGLAFRTFTVNDAEALDRLHADKIDTPAPPVIDTATWNLQPGDHTIRFYLRRDGVQLDTIQLVDNAAALPDSCIINGQTVSTGLPQAECDALDGLLVDEYRTPGDPCEWGGLNWRGVICDLTGTTVVKIDFNSSGNDEPRLVDSVPSEIGNLTNLTELRLDNNRLTELPPEIGNLTNLTNLSLYNNNLTELPPEIAQLTKLTEFRLDNNRLTELPPEIAQLSNLASLDLEDNDLTQLPPEIGNLTNLTELNLSENDLTQLPPEIGNLTNLTSLELSDTDLTDLPPQIGNLTNLNYLGLRFHILTELPAEIVNLTNVRIGLGPCLPTPDPAIIEFLDQATSTWSRCAVPLPSDPTCTITGVAVITQLPQAECDALSVITRGPRENPCDSTRYRFSITCNAAGTSVVRLRILDQIEELAPEIAQLTNLTSLELGGNRLTELPAEFAQLTNLTSLELDANQFTELPLEIAQLTNLTYLSLYNNNLTELPPEIAQLTNLTILELTDNELTEVPPEIAQLTNLTYLSFSGNNLTEVPPEIAQLTNLRLLSLSFNNLTEVPPEIAQLTNLTDLSLGFNMLRGNVDVLAPFVADPPTRVQLGDGEGGNDCLTTTNPDLAILLASPRNIIAGPWDRCDNP